jgi:hypothetical protein
MKKTFDIVTLSDCPGCRKTKPVKRRRRLADPITTVAAIVALLPKLFDLFGKRALTMSDLNQLFPSNGTWSYALKAHLLKHIAWVDSNLQNNVDLKMRAFISETYAHQYCMDLSNAGCFVPYKDTYECPECTQRFLTVLNNENSNNIGGGVITEAGFGNLVPYLLVGVFAWFFISDKTKKKK